MEKYSSKLWRLRLRCCFWGFDFFTIPLWVGVCFGSTARVLVETRGQSLPRPILLWTINSIRRSRVESTNSFTDFDWQTINFEKAGVFSQPFAKLLIVLINFVLNFTTLTKLDGKADWLFLWFDLARDERAYILTANVWLLFNFGVF